jgi:hypothetical protein
MGQASNSAPVIYMTGKDNPTVRESTHQRMPRLSHKAVLGEVADRAAQESLGFLTLPKALIVGARWRATIFHLPGEAIG